MNDENLALQRGYCYTYRITIAVRLFLWSL